VYIVKAVWTEGYLNQDEVMLQHIRIGLIDLSGVKFRKPEVLNWEFFKQVD